MMKKRKVVLISLAVLLGIVPVILSNTQAKAAESDTPFINDSLLKTFMHDAIAYDKDGNKTKKMYYAYNRVWMDVTPVTIKNGAYYKVSGKDQYIKITNVDGVKRKIISNSYIYRTSTVRTTYNGKWKLYKGDTVTTYGGSYKFANGKHYFRVGGPDKQYIKSYNLGPIISTNTNSTNNEETTVTVSVTSANLLVAVPGKIVFQPSGKVAKKSTTYTVDRLEQGSRADTGRDGDDDNELAVYHIKGTDYWISNFEVKAAKQLPVHNYYETYNSYIKFTKNVDVYNADGTKQDHNGIQIVKQGGSLRVDKLTYIWVPAENKAELFYHLVGHKFYSTKGDTIEVGKDAYVKAADVEFLDYNSVPLKPNNTPQQAQTAAMQNKAK